MYLSTRKPWFAFLVHPRNVHDLDTIRAAVLLRDYTDSEEEYVAKACQLPPLVLGDVTIRAAPISGEIVCAVRMPEQILGDQGVPEITLAARLASERGAAVIGLGALTAPATGGGLRLRSRVPASTAITTGNGFTAVVAVTNIKEAAAWMGRGSRARIAVLGATGSVGGAVSRLLAAEGWDLSLLGRHRDRTAHLFKDLVGHVRFDDDLGSLHEADIVLSLTNHDSARLDPAMLRPETVVIDVAQPKNISGEHLESFHRSGISVVDGALVRIPGYRCAQDFTLPSTSDTFACLAETYLMARAGLQVDSLGRAEVEHARLVGDLAEQFGVRARDIHDELERPHRQGAREPVAASAEHA